MEISYIILGWLLGILSPSIQRLISKEYDKDNLNKIILNNLRDLKKRLAPLPFLILPRYGKLDKEKFEWIRNNVDIDFEEGIKEMLEQGTNQEMILNQLNETGLKKDTLSYFKKMHLFAIDSHLGNFALIDSVGMAKVLEIRFLIEAFNEDVDNFREHLKMTFQSGITEANHEIVSQQLRNLSLDIADRSMHIVDKINIILDN